MDRFDAMRIFTRVGERRSFTLAADDLGLPRSTATDAVKQLERRLGVRLLERTTRVVRPTVDGEAYYQRCVRLIADLEDTEAGFQRGQAFRSAARRCARCAGTLFPAARAAGLSCALSRHPLASRRNSPTARHGARRLRLHRAGRHADRYFALLPQASRVKARHLRQSGLSRALWDAAHAR